MSEAHERSAPQPADVGLHALYVGDEIPVETVNALRVETNGPAVELTVTDSLFSVPAMLSERSYDAVIIDLSSAGAFGLDALALVRLQAQSSAILAIAPNATYDTAVAAINMGAQDVLGSDHLNPEVLRRAMLFAVERTRRESRHLNHAMRDILTGLPNRALLQDRLRESTMRAKRNQGRAALLFIDLDKFKCINDTHGHDAGDEVLVVVAQRLLRAVRDTDFVTRQGGDEFIVVLEDMIDVAEASVIAARRRAAAPRPLAYRGTALEVGASIGIAVYPDDGADMHSLMRVADEVMYEAKRHGRNRVYTVDILRGHKKPVPVPVGASNVER